MDTAMNTKHKLYFPLFLTLIYFICTINISYSYIKNISTYNPVKNISDANTTPPASLTSNSLSTAATFILNMPQSLTVTITGFYLAKKLIRLYLWRVLLKS